MQPLTAHDFGYNSPAFNCLRGIPSILLKTDILRIGGEGGTPAQIRWRTAIVPQSFSVKRQLWRRAQKGWC